MLKKLATMVGYVKAPKAMFMLRHPVKGTKTLLAAKGLKGLVTTRAGATLGAVLAVPVGLAAWKATHGGDRDRRGT